MQTLLSIARIREEIAAGKTVRSAIKIGFEKAMSAIVDGNITTLIAAAVLGVMGSGTVKGFAMTLALGIVLSMFTALVISRLLVNAFYAVGLRDEKFYGKQKERKTIDFLGKQKIIFYDFCYPDSCLFRLEWACSIAKDGRCIELQPGVHGRYVYKRNFQ